MTALTVIFLCLLMALEVPLYAVFLCAGVIGALLWGDPSWIARIPRQIFGSMDPYALMSIVFFIMTGNLMNRSGLTDRLLNLSCALTGSHQGGSGYPTVIGGAFLAGVNGSTAGAVTLGERFIPAMKQQGFPRGYAAGLTASSALVGPILPPSLFMTVYSAITGTSMGGLFAAGILPGLLLVGVVAWIHGRFQRKYSPTTKKRSSWTVQMRAFGHAIPGLLAPTIIAGGVIVGTLSPTEAGALAAVYCLITGLVITGELSPRNAWLALRETVNSASSVLLVVGASSAMGWLLRWEAAAQSLWTTVTSSGLLDHPRLFMIAVSLAIFLIGTLMEEVTLLTVLTPLLAPLGAAAGINPYHFGLVMTFNVTIAMIKLPFIIGALGVLLTMILWPPMTVFLPRLAGY